MRTVTTDRTLNSKRGYKNDYVFIFFPGDIIAIINSDCRKGSKQCLHPCNLIAIKKGVRNTVSVSPTKMMEKLNAKSYLIVLLERY